LIQKYVEKRKLEQDLYKEGHLYITPRTLLGVIRLAQGLARLRFNDEVEQIDVDEALRLTEYSRNLINQDSNTKQTTTNVRTDPVSAIFHLLRDICNSSLDKTAKFSDIERRVTSKGFKKEQLLETIEEYQKLDVLYMSKSMTEVTLI
jgi:DNA replication licensing factor MCM7